MIRPNLRVKIDQKALREIRDTASEKSVSKVVDYAYDEARRLCPVDTGKLRESIDKRRMSIIAETDYALFVEIGTRFMAAQPFLRPAMIAAGERFTRNG